jgi:hypothetical protein
MEAQRLELIRAKSKLGHSLSQISTLTGLTIEEIKETFVQITGLTTKDVSIIFLMTQRGLSLEQISQETGVELEVLKYFLPDVLEETVETHAQIDRSPPTTTEDTKEPHKPLRSKTLFKPQPSHTPTYFYSCRRDTNQLHMVNLLTGEKTCLKVLNYQFNKSSRWSELPGGSLLITGGGDPAVKEVVKIDALRECAVSFLPPMHTARYSHTAVYHSQYVYVLGGYRDSYLRECERYACADSRWEKLPALPIAGNSMSAVELENSLYALGGCDGRSNLDTVQKLSLDSLTWELMHLKLPRATYWIPCFKTNSQAYLVIEDTLYSFSPHEVKPIKTLPERIWCSTSYYSRGTLYYPRSEGILSLAVGELTSP